MVGHDHIRCETVEEFRIVKVAISVFVHGIEEFGDFVLGHLESKHIVLIRYVGMKPWAGQQEGEPGFVFGIISLWELSLT